MANIGESLKNAMVKSMEAIGNTASNIANNTKYKVTEMNLVSRRREILSDFAARAYAIWQTGEEKFPEELDKQLAELYHVDEQLNAIRMEHLAGIDAPAKNAEDNAEDDNQEETSETEEKKAEPDSVEESEAVAETETDETVQTPEENTAEE